MSMALFCRPPVEGGSEPQASGGFCLSEKEPRVRYAHAPLNRGAKT